ncbi:MAG: DoxX family protein [Muribaculaceae bacterium]|nr:DoxX family protein [Muribaculaceae bacterium]
MTNIFKQLYIRTSGYSYTNMGRLFLRLFVGLMLLQFGLRQWIGFEGYKEIFPSVMGTTPECGLIIMIVVEVVCSLFIMFGFLTRLMVLPPFIVMVISEIFLLSKAHEASYLISWTNPVYLPIMFMGIFFFILLVGPGKISVDYFLSLHFIHSDNQSESELEEV